MKFIKFTIVIICFFLCCFIAKTDNIEFANGHFIDKVKYYLNDNYKLTSRPNRRIKGCLSYLSDPYRPVPYSVTPDSSDLKMGINQDFLFNRADLLSFSTDYIKDTLVMSGSPLVNLYLSISTSDADIVAKLLDEDEQGHRSLVSWTVVNLSSIGADVYPSPKIKAVVPGSILNVDLIFPNVTYKFKPFHKIVLQIQSTFFPIISVCPQIFSVGNMNKDILSSCIISIYANRNCMSYIEIPKILEDF